MYITFIASLTLRAAQTFSLTHLQQNKYRTVRRAHRKNIFVLYAKLSCVIERYVYARKRKFNVITRERFCATLYHVTHRPFFLKDRRFSKVEQRFGVDI